MKLTLAWHELSRQRGNRPAVVFLHGFLGCGLDWLDVAEGLEGACRCLCADLPGHGDSPPPGEVGMEQVAAAIIDHLDRLEVPRAGLVGYSMGGRLALFLAAEYPKRFAAVVLESATPGLADRDEREQRLQQDTKLAATLEAMPVDTRLFREFLEQWYSQPIFSTLSRNPQLLKRLIEQRAGGRPEDFAAALRVLSVGAQPSLWEMLPGFHTPTLLIVGEQDRKYRIVAENMCEACPNMAMEVFAGCSHNVHFENLGGYTTLLRRFLTATL